MKICLEHFGGYPAKYLAIIDVGPAEIARLKRCRDAFLRAKQADPTLDVMVYVDEFAEWYPVDDASSATELLPECDVETLQSYKAPGEAFWRLPRRLYLHAGPGRTAAEKYSVNEHGVCWTAYLDGSNIELCTDVVSWEWFDDPPPEPTARHS